MANYSNPFFFESPNRFGIRSPSTAQSAVKALLDRQILVQDEVEGVVFDNPFFRHWVATNGGEGDGLDASKLVAGS